MLIETGNPHRNWLEITDGRFCEWVREMQLQCADSIAISAQWAFILRLVLISSWATGVSLIFQFKMAINRCAPNILILSRKKAAQNQQNLFSLQFRAIKVYCTFIDGFDSHVSNICAKCMEYLSEGIYCFVLNLLELWFEYFGKNS